MCYSNGNQAEKRAKAIQQRQQKTKLIWIWSGLGLFAIHALAVKRETSGTAASASSVTSFFLPDIPLFCEFLVIFSSSLFLFKFANVNGKQTAFKKVFSSRLDHSEHFTHILLWQQVPCRVPSAHRERQPFTPMHSHVNGASTRITDLLFSAPWVKNQKSGFIWINFYPPSVEFILFSFLVFITSRLRALPVLLAAPNHPHIHPPLALFSISFSVHWRMNAWMAKACGWQLRCAGANCLSGSQAAVEVEISPSLWFIEKKQLAHKNPNSLTCKHLVWRHPLVWITEGNNFHHFCFVASTWCSE